MTLPSFGELEGKLKISMRIISISSPLTKSSFYLIPDLDTSLLPGYQFEITRVLRTAEPQYLAFAGITGYQLFQWYSKRRFCGCCGKPMVHDKHERKMICSACGNGEYPVLSPAVIVGVTNGDKLILSKYEGRNHTRYAMIAGFAEIGETIEETVHREVMEEIGVKVQKSPLLQEPAMVLLRNPSVWLLL